MVFDGFDQLQELDSELLPKFIKLHELLPPNLRVQLKFIYIVHDTAFLSRYSTYNLPTIIFPRYKHEQVAEILLQKKLVNISKARSYFARSLVAGLIQKIQLLNKLQRITSKSLFKHFIHTPVMT